MVSVAQDPHSTYHICGCTQSFGDWTLRSLEGRKCHYWLEAMAVEHTQPLHVVWESSQCGDYVPKSRAEQAHHSVFITF